MNRSNQIDLVSSRVYPDLERSPGKRDNWVEAVGGLPSYIERIAKHLHYEQGFTISRAIATAVNTVKRWAKGGTVTSHGTTKRITPKTQALAIKALAEWEAKKARARADLSVPVIDLASSLDKFKGHKCSYCTKPATKAILWAEHRAVHLTCDDHLAQGRKKIAGNMGGVEDVKDLSVPTAERKKAASKGQALPDGSFPIRNVEDLRNAIRAIGRAKDPAKAKRHIMRRARALQAQNLIPDTWDLSEGGYVEAVLDLARTKDGRKSYKNQGRWKHGFVPVDRAARVAKAKGSPIALRRIRRLYGASGAKGRKPRDVPETLKASATGKDQERTSSGRVAQTRRAVTPDSTRTQRLALRRRQAEHSRGGGITARSTKPWNEIPESQKVVRNGKRYVVSVYRGQQQLVEWTGQYATQGGPDPGSRKLSSITQADAEKYTTAQLRRLLRVPGQPDHVKKVLNRVLREKARENRNREETRL